ncbi:MAG: PadR family transcriptional regulator [Anaerolineae bacterium]|nr:PadR family transcriptional regulator [Anaerolineae bacterium]
MTNAELAILSLIAEKPRHGYEIEQVIQARGMREWTEIGFSSIYYLLQKLAKQGLISAGPPRPGGRGPARKVYTITPQGQAMWKQNILATLSTPQHTHAPFQLGLANLPGLPAAEARQALADYAQNLTEQQSHILARWQYLGKAIPFHVNAMFELSAALLETELNFIHKLIGQLENQDLSAPPSPQE